MLHQYPNAKQELDRAKKYAHNLLDEKCVVDRHACRMAAQFGVFVDENHDKIPALYKLHRLKKIPYNS